MNTPPSDNEPLPTSLVEAHAEIKKLRAALAEQVTLARIPAQNPNPVYRLGPNRQRLFANAAAERLAASLSPEDLQAGREEVYGWAMDALASARESQHQLCIGNRQFAVHIVPFPEAQYVNMYLTEETARVAAQQQQLAQQAFTQQVLDAVPVMVYVRDADGRYVFENSATRAMADLMAQTPPTPEVAARQARQQAQHKATDAEVLATGRQLVVEDYITLPDGTERCLHTIKQPLTWDGGQTHVLGVSADITALKQAVETATTAAKARENFLANMSHEIRTPMNGVLGIAAQLAKTPLNTRQQELLDIIRSSGRHLLGVINDVLDMAKITSGKIELVEEPFDLCESLFQAAQPLMLQALEKGLHVTGDRLRETCPHPQVIGDAHRINQVMLNLLSNAIKFTPAGGSIHAGTYLVEETADTLTIEFRVRDTGVGIAPNKQERIFEDFAQAYADTTRIFGGTGLGLSISRALVERMGGKLSVESGLGEGSTFSFRLTLPRATAAETPPVLTSKTDYDTGALRGKRLLMVEDNDINRLVARMLLEDWGVELDEAEDGLAGLACVQQNSYDAVLMDIQLPGLSGLEVTAAIRALLDPEKARLPILALTANAFQNDTDEYLAAGMNDGISKPFEAAELYGKLVRLLAPA
ncbi:PAS domain-containing hybrid sensor histidine kinase/response regulator [Hymenobacter guriensis]|uniref:histidine kinase n=1 Tax=Hymenobacter guriensis TaxID=2793065 RepID=A0ABS0L797_9BACT|nr:PAS domain-containing hybrid sensor histidine kinase/response regulator [Hymenobacter guriensis]MBG8555995.1 response regulator [Hymenobacter guriensis]